MTTDPVPGRAGAEARTRGRPDAVARGERAALYPVLAAAFVLRAWHLGTRSVWTDEGSTWTAAHGSIPDLIRHCTTRDASPPLYYLLTWLALRAGDAEAQLRTVSVIASLAMVWLTYRLARLFAPRREAVFAAALCAIAPFQILYAQEARTYATVAALMTWALFLFARALKDGRRRDWVALALVQALALYTQQIAFLGIGAQAVVILLSPEGRRRMGPWLASIAVAGALFVPWVAVSLAQTSRMSESHWYVPRVGGHGIFQVLRAILLAPVPLLGSSGPGAPARLLVQGLLTAAPLVPLAVSLARARAKDSRGLMLYLMACVAFLPLIAVLLSSLHEPLLLSRYFVFVGPPVTVLLAHGTLALKPAWLARAWGVLLLAIGVWGWVRYDRDYDKEPWREITARIGRNAAPGAAVLVPFDVDAFAYYDRRLGLALPAFEVSHPNEPFAAHYTPAELDQVEQSARARAREFDEVWVVVRSPNSEVRREVVRRAEAAAAEGRTLVERGRLQPRIAGPITFSRYRRTPAPGR